MWPTVTELARSLGVSSAMTEALEAELARALGASIEQVAHDIGYESVAVSDLDTTPEATGFLSEPEEGDDPETIVPNESLAQAALVLATTAMKAPSAPFGVAAVFDAGGMYVARTNPNYTRLLVGSRERFGVG